MLTGTRLTRRAIAAAIALAFAGSTALVAQTQNPMVGHWSLNAAKSTASGPMAKKRDLTITQKGADVTVVVDEVMADGTANKWSFTTKGDGKPVPATGWAVLDTATSTLSGHKGKTTYSKAGKVVMESNTEVSADGKTLVITGSRPGPDGKPMTFSSHYDRR